jgi:hypothetical protein
MSVRRAMMLSVFNEIVETGDGSLGRGAMVPFQEAVLSGLYHNGQTSKRSGVAIPAQPVMGDTERTSGFGNSQSPFTLSWSRRKFLAMAIARSRLAKAVLDCLTVSPEFGIDQ